MRSRRPITLAWSTALAFAAALPLSIPLAATPPPLASGDCGDVAVPLDTSAIYRMPVSGTVTIKVGDIEDPIAVTGATEMTETNHDSSKEQVAVLALNGTSEVLHGKVTFTGSCHPDRVSTGNLGTNSVFNLYLDVETANGALMVVEPVTLKASSAAPIKIGEQRLSDGNLIPVYHAALTGAATGGQPINDASGHQIGIVTRVSLTSERIAAHRPCCPLPGAKAATKKAAGVAASLEPGTTPAAGGAAGAPQGGH